MIGSQALGSLVPLVEGMRHPCWVLQLQPSRRFAYVNPAFERTWGRSAAELYANPRLWAERIHPDDRAHVVEGLEACLHDPARQRFDAVYRVIGAGGEARWLEDHAGVLRDAEGMAWQVSGMAEDVTDRRRVRRCPDDDAPVAAVIDDAELFSYSVAHDLHAPLRALDGFAQALAEDYGALLPEPGRRQVRVIRDRARQMSRLIDDMLAFSRLARQPLAKRAVDNVALVRDALEELEPMRLGRRVDLQIGPLPDCQGDAAMLRQVWVNLLSNALKYTRQRETAVIEIGGGSCDGWRTFYVRDNGAGFDMRYVHKLFSLFERLHRSEDFEGTGLGLAIVRRIVQRHGGRVRAEGEPSRGATFGFDLADG